MTLSTLQTINFNRLAETGLVNFMLQLMIEFKITELLMYTLFEFLSINVVGRCKAFRNRIDFRFSIGYCSSITITIIRNFLLQLIVYSLQYFIEPLRIVTSMNLYLSIFNDVNSFASQGLVEYIVWIKKYMDQF